MPSKNSRKHYASNTFYHIYNRGVERRQIFIDDKDYRVFINGLRVRLSRTEPTTRLSDVPLNFVGTIELHGFCLMPNHFHLLIRQLEERVMTRFMRSITNSYVRYFNLRYGRVGSLLQDKYKAAMILNPEQLLQASAYIHRNPIELTKSLEDYPYSSYRLYCAPYKPTWLCTDEIPLLTNGKQGYSDFVEAQPLDGPDLSR